MFRIGGSAGTGITSGLERKGYKEGTDEYDRALKTTERFMTDIDKFRGEEAKFTPSGLPGFLTQFGLNLLSTPPQGNIFATAATAARDPFNLLQASQVESMKTASDRKFARELAAEEREFEESQLEKKIAAEKEIAGMNISDRNKRIEAIADKNYEGDIIKAQREVDFPTTVYPGLKEQYGDKQVSTAVIDTSILSTPKKIDKFVDQNPFLASKVVYDVATDKAMRVVRDRLTGQFVLIPADSADIDTTGDAMPEPKTGPDFTYLSPGQQKTLENIREASDSDFGMGFYE